MTTTLFKTFRKRFKQTWDFDGKSKGRGVCDKWFNNQIWKTRMTSSGDVDRNWQFRRMQSEIFEYLLQNSIGELRKGLGSLPTKTSRTMRLADCLRGKIEVRWRNSHRSRTKMT